MNLHGQKRSYEDFSIKYPNLFEIDLDPSYYDPKYPRYLAKKKIFTKINNILKINFIVKNEIIKTVYVYTKKHQFEPCSSYKNCCHSSFYIEKTSLIIELTSSKEYINLIMVYVDKNVDIKTVVDNFLKI